MTVDAQTAQWLARSADELSARAPELAADLLQRVLDRAGPAGDQVGRLHLALASAQLRASRFGQAEAAAAAALAAGHDADSAGQLQWIIAHARLNQGDVAEALAGIQQALAGDALTRAERARFGGLAAQCLHVQNWTGPDQAMDAAAAASEEGLVSGDAHAMAYGLQAVAGARRWQGRFNQAEELAAQAAAALERAGPIIAASSIRT
jgi:hypothetical protein